jgi:hypothetical protein
MVIFFPIVLLLLLRVPSILVFYYHFVFWIRHPLDKYSPFNSNHRHRLLNFIITVMLRSRRSDGINISDASHPFVPFGLIHSFFSLSLFLIFPSGFSLIHLAPASEQITLPRGNRHGRPHSIPDLSSGGDRRGQPAPSPAYAPTATRHLLQALAASASVWPGGAPYG